MDYVKQLDTILRVVGIRIRRGVKASKKTTVFGVGTEKGSSEETSLTEPPTSASSDEHENLPDSAVVAPGFDTLRVSEDGADSDPRPDSQDAGESEAQPETDSQNPEFHAVERRSPEEGDDGSDLVFSRTGPDQAVPASSSGDSQATSRSLGGKLKTLFGRKREPPSPEPKLRMGERSSEASTSPGSEDRPSVVLDGTLERSEQEVEIRDGERKVDGNGSSSAASGAEYGKNGIAVTGVAESRGQGGGERGREREGREGRWKSEGGRGKAGRVSSEQAGGVVKARGVETDVCDEDSDEDSYTSSNPSPPSEEEKADPSQNAA